MGFRLVCSSWVTSSARTGQGTIAVPNGGSGIDIEGELFLGAGAEIGDNLVSGNNGKGIDLRNAVGAIHGNRIGTDVSGVLPLGNRSTGVSIDADFHSVITGNTIAFNGVGDPNGEELAPARLPFT